MKKDQTISVAIEVSARHLHLSEQDAGILFGKGHQLKQMKKLTEGNFAAEETVTLAKPAPEEQIEKRKTVEIKNVRALGPYWKKTIVELSRTDSVKLGINPPVKNSIDLNNPPKPANVVLIGPKGKIVREAAIIPHRHLYATLNQIKQINNKWGANLKDGDSVSVKTRGKCSVVFNNVIIRTGENYKLRVFIDTDEANAAGIKGGEIGEIIQN